MSRLDDLRAAFKGAMDANDSDAMRQLGFAVLEELNNQKPVQAQTPTAEMSSGQKFLAGAGKAMADIGTGVGQLVGAIPDAQVEARKQRDAPLMDSGMARAGHLTGALASFLPTALIPGANTASGSALIGAGIGAVQPIGKDDSRLTNTATGALGGYVGSKIGGMLNPQTSPQVQALMKEGVTPTPGQILGGGARRFEEAVKSQPFLGDMIKGAEDRATVQFNKAAINRALAPIGKKINDVGRDAVEEAYNIISKQYDDVLPKLNLSQDKQFVNKMNELVGMAADGLPEPQAQRFFNIVKRQIVDKFTSSGKMSGQTLKEVESDLGTEAMGYLKDQTFDNRKLGAAIRQTQTLLRELAQRTNPQYASELAKLNKAFANYMRIEGAAGRIGSDSGVFTPAQLQSVVRQLDPSKGKRAFAQGNALMQDLSEAGKEVLSNRLPNSGTADRLLANGGALLNPLTYPGAGVGVMAYNPASQWALAQALTRRPETVRQVGRMLQKSPYVSALAAPVAAVEGSQ